MSSPNNELEPIEPAASSNVQISKALEKIRSKRWMRTRPPTAEEARPTVPKPKFSAPTTSTNPVDDSSAANKDSTTSEGGGLNKDGEPSRQAGHHTELGTRIFNYNEAEDTLLLPETCLSMTEDPLVKSLRYPQLPFPGENPAPMRMNVFVLPYVYRWTQKKKALAEEDMKRQLMDQVKPEVGEPTFHFPSSRSKQIKVIFEAVKKYCPAQRLKLTWEGKEFKHKKQGVFLPQNQIVFGLDEISSRTNVVWLLRDAADQLEVDITCKSFQIFFPKGKKRAESLEGCKIAILGEHYVPATPLNKLRGWIESRDELFPLLFEGRDDLCDYCRKYNGSEMPEFNKLYTNCIYCFGSGHCFNTCGRCPRPEKKQCIEDMTERPQSPDFPMEDFLDRLDDLQDADSWDGRYMGGYGYAYEDYDDYMDDPWLDDEFRYGYMF